MDTRNRAANKRYRARDEKYVTISMTINSDLIPRINKKMQKDKIANRSNFIEKYVSEKIPKYTGIVPKKSRHNLNKQTKITVTFTENFAESIKNFGNMSYVVNDILSSIL